MAAQETVTKFEEILKACKDHEDQCQGMQKRVASQVSLEEEIMIKDDEQYNNLKGIIDEQKENAKNIIRNLESVQNYRPPPQNFTIETLEGLTEFSRKVDSMIQSMKGNL
jgi:ferritin-like metal-binding protein YciE